MANIRKRGNKWQVQVRRAGFPTCTKSFNRIEEAKAWARQQEVAFEWSEAGIFKPAKERLLDGQRAAARDLQIIKHFLNIASSEWSMNIRENPFEKVRFPAP